MSAELSQVEKPMLLKAIELIVAEPDEIKKEAFALKEKFQQRLSETKSEDEIKIYFNDIFLVSPS